MPKGIGKIHADKNYVWHYQTEPEAGTANRPELWLRGKTLGGSSAINGMVYVRGQARDFDDWAEAGAIGWDWSVMANYFRYLEDHALGDDGVRGVGGPVHVAVHPQRIALCDAVIAAGAALGLPRREDINRPDHEGIGYQTHNIKAGRRVSSAQAFLD